MRAVLTRVSSASVSVDGKTIGQIGKGFLVLLGVHVDDTAAEADRIADRICGIRIFEDAAGKMNVSPADAGAEILIISMRIHVPAGPALPPQRGRKPQCRSMSASSRSAGKRAFMWKPVSLARKCRWPPATTGRSRSYLIRE